MAGNGPLTSPLLERRHSGTGLALAPESPLWEFDKGGTVFVFDQLDCFSESLT